MDPDAVLGVSGVGQGMAVLDGGGYRRRGRGSSGDEFGAFHCNQWRLVLRSCARVTHSSQISLGEDLLKIISPQRSAMSCNKVKRPVSQA